MRSDAVGEHAQAQLIELLAVISFMKVSLMAAHLTAFTQPEETFNRCSRRDRTRMRL